VKILLTGATGFIGRRLAAELSRRHEVVAVGRERPEMPVEWIEQDLARPMNRGALPQRLDAVVHLAQSRRYRDFPDGAGDMFSINVQSTFSLLEHARAAGAQTFIFASTGGIYAHSYDALVETDPVLPLDFYLTSKHVAEQLIGNYRSFFHTIVFRFFFVYGPGQRRMLVPTLAERVLRSETVTVEGTPGLRINPIYVEDAIRVFEPALTLGSSELFNVAGDEVVAIDELVRAIGRATARDPLLEHTPGSQAGDLVGDNARMKSVLGVEPRVTLEEGLAATCAELAP
jgi:UDP-glucose 4-epimerase